MLEKGKVLGIDYGDKRIGIAISDVDQTMAFGKTSIENSSLKEVIKSIIDLCNAEKVVKIVVGLPLSMEGKKTAQTEKVENFVNALKEPVKIPIEYHDERLTSLSSDVILNTLDIRGKSKHKTRKTERDIIAASLILENYLHLKGKRGKR